MTDHEVSRAIISSRVFSALPSALVNITSHDKPVDILEDQEALSQDDL